MDEIASPFILATPPWGNLKLQPSKDGVVVVDNKQVRISELKQVLVGEVAYVLGATQKSFNRLCECIDVQRLDFYQMRVADVSALHAIPRLNHLALRCNTKVENIDVLPRLHLATLILEGTPKIANLEPLSACNNLVHLTYSGGYGFANYADSLEPISQIKNLQELVLQNLRVGSDGLMPLAGCLTLKELVISNQFSTEEFAMLSVRLYNVRCDMFQSYISIKYPRIDGADVMIVGKRKPRLNSITDFEKIASFDRAFTVLQESFRH